MNATRALGEALSRFKRTNRVTLNRTNAISRAMWGYCMAIVVFWVVYPEIRRLLDWRAGFHASQLLSIAPLLGMAVFAFAVTFRSQVAVSGRMILLSWIWIGSFVYAGVIGVLLGHGLSSLYDLLQFIAPMFIALWLASDTYVSAHAFQRLSTLILWIAVAVSIYGIIQFVALPPWDAAWLRQVATIRHMVTNGGSQPFEVRVFSVLNSAGTCASFLAVAIALNLYRLKDKRLVPLGGMLLCIVTLMLTLERSAWVSLAVAIAVYLLFSPKAWRTASVGLACGIGLAAFFWLASPWVTAHTGTNNIAERLQTFSHLNRDISVSARVASTADLLSDAITYPMGEGLGIIGPATQLTSFTESINAIDGGLQARFAEMGFAGFGGYIATLLLALIFGFQRWRQSKRSGDNTEGDALAALLAVQAMLIVLDFSIDSHIGLLGALFWLSVGISLSPQTTPANKIAGDVTLIRGVRTLVGVR